MGEAGRNLLANSKKTFWCSKERYSKQATGDVEISAIKFYILRLSFTQSGKVFTLRPLFLWHTVGEGIEMELVDVLLSSF